MSGKPLVPSKDALRTLRALASSPPAALLGTVGAFCGIAAAHYHERQRVRRAQAIIETKRKLHSISKGRGSARLALMFEAAEKGEDFTIQRARRQEIPSRRRYSEMATRPQPEDDQTQKLYFAPGRNAKQSETISRRGDMTTSEKWTSPAQPLLDLIQDRSTDIADDNLEDVTASKKSQRRSRKWNNNSRTSKSSAWTHMMHDSQSSVRQLPQRVRDILSESRESPALGKLNMNARQRSPLSPEHELLPDQSVTDLSPAEDFASLEAIQSKSLSGPEKTRSIILPVDITNAFSTSSFSSLQPWDVVPPVENFENDRGEPDYMSPAKVTYPDLYVYPLSPAPVCEKRHSYASRYDLLNEAIRDGMASIGVDRYSYVFTNIMNFRQDHGKHEALSLLEQTMERYTITDRRKDFALVQALYIDCTRLFPTNDLKPLVWRFVDKFLQGDMPKLEVVSFLYPRCGAGVPSGEQHYYFLAHQYLEMIGEKPHGLDRQVAELRKVLSGTHMCNIAPHEHLILPALRSLCHAGRMTSAQALFNEMTSIHKIEATFYTLQVLIKGYAKAGNWSRVKSILDDCHYQELAQRKVYGLSGLLVSIVNDYAIAQPPEKVVGFLMHTLKEYGIQPVSGMTREIVSLCLRECRYDLVVNWINMVRTDYPHIEVGSGSATFAFDISCVWRDTDASCEDILAGCRAIAGQALRDPFSKVFRSAISDAATRYMKPRLKELRGLIGDDVPESPSGQVGDFHKSLKQLKELTSQEARGSRARLLLSHILAQGEALRWINALCKGHTQSQGVVARSLRLDEEERSGRNTQVDQLPPISELEITLMSKYAQRNKSGLTIEHDSLRDVVSQLVLLDRISHAFHLIQLVYDSRWAQPPIGREFGLDIFARWLKLAWNLKSGTKIRSVLWAILDASPQLKLDSQIILLARIAAPKAHLQKVKSARKYEVDEVEYLRLRLRRRLWASSANKRGLEFDEWRGFGKSIDHSDSVSELST